MTRQTMQRMTQRMKGLGGTALLAVIAAAFLLLPTTGFAQSNPAGSDNISVAYVDLQRALSEVEDGQQLRAQLQQQLQSRQQEFNQKQQEVQKFQQEMESGFEMLNAEAQRAKLEEYQTKLSELQQLYQEYQQELSRQEMEGTSKIFERMVEIITDISKERDYTLVLEKSQSSLLYADSSMDFTDEVIKRYDKKY